MFYKAPLLRQSSAQQSPPVAAQLALGHSTPFFQPNLTVNLPDDRYEQEADHVADQVMRMNTHDTPVVQRKCSQCKQEEKEKGQRKETGGGANGHSAPSIFTDSWESANLLMI